MELISSDLKIDFIGKSKFALLLSFVLAIASIYIWVSRGEDKYGIDYKGGHAIVVQVPSSASSENIRSALKTADISGAIVQSFEEADGQYSIRLGGSLEETETIKSKVKDSLSKFLSADVKILQTDYVGPTIGAELRKNALIATIIGLICILIYISFRFDFSFALGAVVALFHDVIIGIGIYLACGHMINMATLAAVLTIVGYSVNDTIIVFDRVREEMMKAKSFDLDELLNRSINSTLSRTVITSLLTLFSALALLLFGGGAIADLSLFLVIGIIVGTYSTFFIASPVARAWEMRQLAKIHK
ncbi:MAG: protein translocase subunit SecF [Bdellovibrionales bacterium]|nr:protein translocase subunit SecF [Bdellovibrionales bacterium]